MESSNEYSNFITPPDFVDEIKHTVLVIDISQDELQALAMFCKNSAVYFNVYIYNYDMRDNKWLSEAQNRSDAIIIKMSANNQENKEMLLSNKNTWYYGCEALDKNPRHLNNPLEYFIKYIKNR